MNIYKRIILITNRKLKQKQVFNLGLDLFEKHCYTKICSTENIQVALSQMQEAGIRCKIIIVDEFQFASGNGVITDTVILPIQK